MAPNYCYQELCHDDSIRVLVIQPGSGPDVLRADLKEIRFQDDPQYEAVSYCWGEAVFDAALYLGDDALRLPITATLSSALHQIRDQQEPRTIWVDAICINQTNEEEKGHQVWLMSRVYRNAQQVLVWLGEGNNATHPAVEGIERLAGSTDVYWGEDYMFERFGFPKQLFWNPEDVRDVVKEGREARIFALLSYPWYHRLWIIQEIFLAESITVLCGSDSISWKQFSRAVILFADAITAADSWSSLDNNDSEALQCAETIIRRRVWFRMWSTPGNIVVGSSTWCRGFVLDIIEQFRNQQCYDDRDRVYGFLALRRPDDNINFKPNYHWTVHQTYKEFAKAVLKYGSLDIIDQAGLWQREQSWATHELSSPNYHPSWAPDYRPNKVSSTLPLALRSHSFSTATNSEGLVDLSERRNHILLFRGGIFDEPWVMLRCGVDCESPRAAVEHLRKLYDCLELEAYPTGEKNLHAFLRTLVMDDKSIDIERLVVFWEAYDAVAFGEGDSQNHDPLVLQQAFALHERMLSAFGRDSLVVTKTGFLGLVPHATELKDRIAIIAGRETPYVVRWVEEYDAYVLVGPCYIHGLMEWDYDNPAGKYIDSLIPIA